MNIIFCNIGYFNYEQFGKYYIPYIIRVISGEELKFVSVRMAETELFRYYLQKLHEDLLTCMSVTSHFITDSEAKLLCEINRKHCDGIYGKDPFCADKDYIVRLEDAYEFHAFIETSYRKLQSKITPGYIERCGFIRINSNSVVPYSLQNGRKYVPLFYFEGDTEGLERQTIQLEDWNLAYLKFCCKVQGIRNELYTRNSCKVISIDNIKKYFSPETNFEEYWPAKVIKSKLLIKEKVYNVIPSSLWTKPPSKVPAPESTISHTLTASALVMPQSMPMIMNTFQCEWPPNQMVCILYSFY